MAACSAVVVEVVVVGLEEAAGKVPEVGPRMEVGSVVGYGSAGQGYLRCYCCDSCWASSGTHCSVDFVAGHDTEMPERQSDCVEEAETGRRQP